MTWNLPVVIIMAEYKNEKGMNLLEVMLTMFMIALISSSLMCGFTVSQKIIKQAGLETRASSFAYQILEDLRARPAEDWDDIARETEQGSYVYTVSGSEEYGKNLQATVSLNEDGDIPSLYNVQVVVTWEYAGITRSLEMVTFLNPALKGAVL
jgi:Tfp pilus assembly protein PilV